MAWVTVAVTAPGGPVVTGPVTVTVDGVALAPQTLGASDSTIFTIVLPVVGTHNLVANYAAQSIFLASTARGTLVVSPATLTVTANPATMPYGGPLPAFSVTATGLVTPDTLTSMSFNQVCTTTATATSPVGIYPIDCSSSTIVAPNYTVIYVPGTLTVTPVPLTITANNAIKTYGRTVTFLGTEFTVTGLLNGDAVASVTLTSTGAPATAAVGSYPIVPSAAVGTGLTNYTITYTNGTLTVNPVALTITANNASKNCGQTATFLGTEFTATGLLNGNTVTSVTLTSTGAPATAAVGSYPIVPSAALGTGLTNYTINYVNGTLTVTPAGLTITANNAIKTYGQTVTFSGTAFTAAGLLNGNTVTGVTLTSAGAPATAAVGSYPIVPSAALGTGLANYAITHANGTLTVNRAALTITANSATRVWGFANPAFSVSYAGFVNGDTAASLGGALVCSSTATPTSALGTYPINCSGQTSTNYPITYAPGTLTVTNAIQISPLSLTFAAQKIGTASNFQVVSVTNIGGAALTTLRATFTAANGGDFVRGGGNGGGSCDASLAAGATCTLNVRFRPLATGVRTASLSVTATGGNSGTVALTGTGNGATAAVSPASNNFGAVTRGQSSAPFTFTVTNSGTTAMTFATANAFTVAGANPGPFVVTTAGLCANGQTLAPLASCTFTVTFSPGGFIALGAKTTTVRIRSNAVNGTQSVTVLGTAK